jgi:hypothetical protein
MNPILQFFRFLFLVILFQSNSALAQSEWNLQKNVVFFAPGSAFLDSPNKKGLFYLAENMKANPDFRVVLEGNFGHSTKNEQLFWKRIETILQYLTTQSVYRERFIFSCKSDAAADMIFYRTPFAGEESCIKGPPPHPDLRR